MNMHNLIEYSENYSQTSGSLWLYYRDQRALDNNGNIIGFPANDDTSLSFKYKKMKLAGQEMMAQKRLKYSTTKISK